MDKINKKNEIKIEIDRKKFGVLTISVKKGNWLYIGDDIKIYFGLKKKGKSWVPITIIALKDLKINKDGKNYEIQN